MLRAPQLLVDRTRIKYVPSPTPVATYDVAWLCVSNDETLDAPGAEPASITYEAAESPACQVSVTVGPSTVAERFDAACDGVHDAA